MNMLVYLRIDPQSYDYFMKENLFNHIDSSDDHSHIPNGAAADLEQ